MDKYIGTTVGIYTIEEKTNQKTKDGHALYRCKCNICGTDVFMRIVEVKNRHTRCSHLFKKWSNRRLGKIFRNMIGRCYDKTQKDYKWYGGKGIKVCNEWLNNHRQFEQWAFENGYQDNLTIDRINSNGDYCPENCVWISLSENARKAGKVNWIEVNGIKLTGKQWATKLNVGINRINRMIREKGVEETKKFIKTKLNEICN